MRREFLPGRPLRITRRYRNAQLWALALLGVLAVVLTFANIFSWRNDLATLAHEQVVWDRGVPCEDGSEYEGVGESDTRLTIRCVTDGKVLTGKVKLPGIKVADFPEAIEVRFDPDDPTSFAVSAGIDHLDKRRTSLFLLLLLLEGAILGGCGVFIFVVLRNLLRARRLGSAGDERAVHIDHVWTKWNGNSPSHKRIVGWRIEPGAKLRKTTLDATQGLAWIDATSQQALALVSPDGKYATLLTATFHGLDLTAEEREAAMQRLADAGGGTERPLLEVGTLLPKTKS